MTATLLKPSLIAGDYYTSIRRSVAALTADRSPLRIVGLLHQKEGPAATYAHYARRGSAAVGIELEVLQVEPSQVEDAIAGANLDNSVDGIFLYYPLIDPTSDRWLRELVDPRKDVEGLHSFWSRLLYENQRYVDPAGTQQAILPCTPLAIIKILQAAGMRSATGDAPLEGMTASVFNRSDLVGRPLAAMLANDGARVYSFDLAGTVVFEPAIGRRTHDIRESAIGRSAALAQSGVVISAVPSQTFDLIRGDEIQDGAICVNVAENANFDKSILNRASVFAPRVGPLTIAMVMRNLTRLVPIRLRRLPDVG